MDNYNNYDPNSGQANSQQPVNDYGTQQNGYTTPQQNNMYGGGQQYGYNMQMAPEEKKGQSIASLVLGICGFIAWIIPLFGYPVTIVGIVMGALGMKKGGKGMAIAGIICSSIALILTILNSVAGAMLALNGMSVY